MKNTLKQPKAKTSASRNGSKKAPEAASENNQAALVVSEAARPRRFSQDFSAGGRTQQHFKDSCNVNTIVAHYTQTGIDPYADRIGKQTFGFATSRDFSQAMQATAEVNSAFASLPSAERASFKNDPAIWMDHVTTLAPEVSPDETPEEPQEPETAPTPTPTPPETPSPDS